MTGCHGDRYLEFWEGIFWRVRVDEGRRLFNITENVQHASVCTDGHLYNSKCGNVCCSKSGAVLLKILNKERISR